MKHRRFPLTLAAGALAIGVADAQTPTQMQWLNSDPTFVSNTVIPSLGGAPFVATGDLDGDNDVDAVCGLAYVENGMVLGAAPTYGVLTSNGTCAIDPFLSNLNDGALADLDGDGLPELAAVTGPLSGGGGSLGVWANVAPLPGGCTARRLVDSRSVGWNFTLPTAGEGVIVIADFDGDGDRDFVIGGATGVRFVRNDPGTGTARNLVNSTASLAGVAVTALAAADFDADGDVDLAVGGGAIGAGVTIVAANNGVGGFATVAGALPAGFAGVPLSATAADVDADGDTDLVYGFLTRGTAPSVFVEGGLRVFANGGAGIFALAQIAAAGESITDVAVGDMDEDGLVDLIAGSRQEAASFFISGAWQTFFTQSGTRFFGRPAAGAAFADLTLAAGGAPGRIGDNSGLGCPTATNPIVDAVDPASCLPLDATGVALADLDLDLDLDVLVTYRLPIGLGVFTNLLWQLEAPRAVAAVQIAPNSWTWDVPYDHYCEFNVPNFGNAGGWAVLGASLTAPVHVFPAGALGVVTSAPYVTGPVTFFTGQGQFVMTLGPFPTATMTSLIGTRVWATSAVASFGRNLVRLSSVVDTTLL